MQAPNGDPPQTSEVGSTYNEASREEINAEKSPDSLLNEPSYRAISTVRSAITLFYIIAGNCFCSGLICLCLWRFSVIKDLTQSGKRAFNTLALLLSAALGFGIGFLFDRIGLFARGTILQSKPHSVEGVCAVVIALMIPMFLNFHVHILTTHSDCLYYERDAMVIHFIIYVPGPHSARSCYFDYLGPIPLPPMLSSWPLWSCAPGFCIQSRRKSLLYTPTEPA